MDKIREKLFAAGWKTDEVDNFMESLAAVAFEKKISVDDAFRDFINGFTCVDINW